jgi:hypothetical protein
MACEAIGFEEAPFLYSLKFNVSIYLATFCLRVRRKPSFAEACVTESNPTDT